MSDKEEPTDDELEKLLGELANSDPLQVSDGKKQEEVIIPPKPRKALPAIDVSIQEENDDDLLMLEASPKKNEDLSEVFGEQLKKVASQYGAVFEEIIVNYKRDREQAQEVIDQFMDVICQGGKVPRIYLEKVADAVRAKNEIAQTAIRALGELPKLISATKNNDMFQNNVSMSFDAAHLKEILEAAKDSDS
jgi:hypothetical protein